MDVYELELSSEIRDHLRPEIMTSVMKHHKAKIVSTKRSLYGTSLKGTPISVWGRYGYVRCLTLCNGTLCNGNLHVINLISFHLT